MQPFREQSSTPFTVFRLALCLAAISPVSASALVDVTPTSPQPSVGPKPVEAVEVAEPASNITLTDSLQFDLICEMHGRWLELPPPEEIPPAFSSYEPWDETLHYMVDLEAMKICDISCTWQSARPVAAINADQIVFHDEPWLQWSVRRSDGRSRLQLGQPGGNPEGVIETNGNCRAEPFSGFPARDEFGEQDE